MLVSSLDSVAVVSQPRFEDELKFVHREIDMKLKPSAIARVLVTASTVLAASLMPPTVSAQNAMDDQVFLDEIIVTAERRDANLQEVPVSMSSFGADDLEALQASNIGDLQSLVPNLSVHVGDANNAVVYIRGVGQVDSIAFFEPGVGIYLDDVYLGRAQGAFLDVVDVERIEVLRGPQDRKSVV